MFFASIGVLLAAAVFAIRRQHARALRVLRTYAIGLAAYFAVVILVSLLGPRRVLKLGDARCFDDWCIAVERADRTISGAPIRYNVTLTLASRARRVSQREKNVVVYLSDKGGRRYDPIPGRSVAPFDVLLRPAESVVATRIFDVPADAREVGVVIAHEGGFPIGWFIIGYETWFRKPTIVRLPS